MRYADGTHATQTVRVKKKIVLTKGPTLKTDGTLANINLKFCLVRQRKHDGHGYGQFLLRTFNAKTVAHEVSGSTFFYEDNPSRHNVSRTLKTVSYISPKLTNTLLVRIFPNLQNSLRDSIKVPKKVAILFYSTKLLCPITGIIRYN